MNNNSLFSKLFKSSEEVVSMFLGLVIVIVAISLVVNYFQKRRGEVSVPGVTTQNKLEVNGEKDKAVVKTELKTGEYLVKKGDSLWKIAEKETGSGFNWTAIAKANNIKNPGSLSAGQKLMIVKSENKVAKDTKVAIAKPTKVETKTETKVEAKTGDYVVVRGDSLWKIAVRTYGDGYKWTMIWKANKKQIRNPNKLEIGMKLVLPTK